MAYEILTTKMIDVTELTSEVKRQVAALEGVDLLIDRVVFRRLTGDFDVSERSLIDAAVAAHDADAIRQTRAARQVAQAVARAKQPATLTLPERVARLELALNLD